MIRLNLGSGQFNLPAEAGWVNIDGDPAMPADLHLWVPPLPYAPSSIAEIYMGHFLEHLSPTDAALLLQDCRRVLVPGGRLGVVVPDTRVILAHYLERRHTVVEIPQGQHWDLDDLDSVCAVFVYSTMQETGHRWSYDADTLRRALERAGFQVEGPIDPWQDARHSCGAWWNLGWNATKPGGESPGVLERAA